MPINHQDILQITDRQTLFGKPVVNVYFYEIVNPASSLTYSQIMIKFDNEIILPMTAIQSTALVHVELEIENLTNGLDFAFQPVNRSGAVTDDISTPNMAFSFKLNRTNKITRSGGKRIGGVADNAFTLNTLNPAYTADMDALALAVGS